MNELITYIFPSRQRPKKFFAALDNIREFSASINYSKPNFRIIAVLDEDDKTMNNEEVIYRLQDYFFFVKFFFGKSEGKISAINREISKINTETKIVCLHSDDMIFVKHGFDNDIRAAFEDGFNGLTHFPDQVQGHKLCTYPIMHIDYLNFFGYIYNPKYNSLYADTEQQEVAKKINKYKFVDKRILEHRHHLWGFDSEGKRVEAGAKAEPDELAKKDNELMYEQEKKKYFEFKNLAIVTSLSPHHANASNQIAAIKSWNLLGNCFSLNSAEEINKLKNVFTGIEFIETDRTAKWITGKPLVTINAMIDFAIERGNDLLLLNSDIELYNFPEELADDGITIFSRYDYESNFIDSKKFDAGFDVFFIPNKYLNIFNPCIYALGMAWWDYHIAYEAMANHIPVYYSDTKTAFHKVHNVQYSLEEWTYLGNYFSWCFKIRQANIGIIGMTATAALKKITSNFGRTDVSLEEERQEVIIQTTKEFKVDIFYKTYNKDFKLLSYSLKTITKNVTGYNKIIIVVPVEQQQEFENYGFDFPQRTLIIFIKEYGSGYLFQQVCKINAHKYSEADFIMFSDSDCIFDHEINLLDFVQDGKPEILYTDYAQIPDAQIWREPTERILGDKVKWEFMRRNTIIYHRSTLVNMSLWKPNLEGVIMGSHRFSEFNLLGAYAFKFERIQYKFINTDDWTYVPPKAEQLWSYFDKNGSEVHRKEYLRALNTINNALGLNITEL